MTNIFTWVFDGTCLTLFLQEAGVDIDPLGDLNTESERKLGQLVLQK